MKTYNESIVVEHHYGAIDSKDSKILYSGKLKCLHGTELVCQSAPLKHPKGPSYDTKSLVVIQSIELNAKNEAKERSFLYDFNFDIKSAEVLLSLKRQDLLCNATG